MKQVSRVRGASVSVAFTLIELLVVVAIISLLASLLLPSLQRAKEKARAVTCMNTLRGLHTALNMYANDNEGMIPPGRDTARIDDCDPWGDWWWGISGLWPYLNNVKAFQCASDPYSGTNPRVMGRLGSPACNTPLASWSEGYSYGWNEWGLGGNNNVYPRIDRIANDVIWLYEHSGGFVHPIVTGDTGTPGYCTDYYAASIGAPVESEDTPYWTPNPPPSFVSKRHLNGFNIITYAGEIRWIAWGTSKRRDWTRN